jgi:hypothetical protein
MEVGLDFIEKENDTVARFLFSKAAGFPVFFPRPNDQVGEREDTLHSGSGHRDGDIPIGKFQRWDLIDRVEVGPHGFADSERFRLGGGKSFQGALEVGKGSVAF